jgi:hypothetical protein
MPGKEIKDEVIRITLPLTDYLEDLLGPTDSGIERKSVKYTTALILDKLAKRQNPQFAHVQFTTFEGEQLERPKVWRIKAYRESFLKWQLDKRRAEKERKEANICTENSTRVQRKLIESATKLGLNVDDPILQNCFVAMANKIAKRKNIKAAQKLNAYFEVNSEEI